MSLAGMAAVLVACSTSGGGEQVTPHDGPTVEEFSSEDPLVRRGAHRELWLSITQQGDAKRRSYDLVMASGETEGPEAVRRLLAFALDADRTMAREAIQVLLSRPDTPPAMKHLAETMLARSEQQSLMMPRATFAGGANDDELELDTLQGHHEGYPERAMSAPLLQAELRAGTNPRACAEWLRQVEALPDALATDLLAGELEATTGCGALRRNLVLAALGRLQRRAPNERAHALLAEVVREPRDADDGVVARAALGEVEATSASTSAAAMSGLFSLTSGFEPDEGLRLEAVRALGQREDPRARAQLERMLVRVKESPAVLSAIVDALEAREGEVATEGVNALLPFTSAREDARFRQRVVAIVANRAVGATALAKLWELSEDPDPEIAGLAEAGLVRLRAGS